MFQLGLGDGEGILEDVESHLLVAGRSGQGALVLVEAAELGGVLDKVHHWNLGGVVVVGLEMEGFKELVRVSAGNGLFKEEANDGVVATGRVKVDKMDLGIVLHAVNGVLCRGMEVELGDVKGFQVTVMVPDTEVTSCLSHFDCVAQVTHSHILKFVVRYHYCYFI